MKNIVIFDDDYKFEKALTAALKTYPVPCKTFFYKDMDRWLNEYIEANDIRDLEEEPPAQEGIYDEKPAFVKNETYSFSVHPTSLDILKVEPDFPDNEEVFGFPVEKMNEPKNFWRSCILSVDEEKFQMFIKELRAKQSRDLSLRILTADKKIRWVHIEGSPESKSSGNIDFLKLHLRDCTQEVEEKENEAVEKTKTVSSAAIDLVILSVPYARKNIRAKITQINEEIKNQDLLPQDETTNFFLTDHEGPDINIENYTFPEISDFIFKPIDPLLFLQKLELSTSDSSSEKESFLYSMDVDEDVFLARNVHLKKLSNFGFSISSNVPFKIGISAFFFSPLFHNENEQPVIAKSYQCTTDPNNPNRHLIFFSFFGISPSQIRSMNDWYMERATPIDAQVAQPTVEKKKKTFQVISPEGAEKRKPAKKTILIIDLDADAIQTAEELVSRRFEDYQIITYNSPKQAMRELFSSNKAQSFQWSSDPAFQFANDIRLIINPENMEFQSLAGDTKPSSFIFGHTGQKFIDDPELWLNIIDAGNRESLMEVLNYIRSGNVASCEVAFEMALGGHKWIWIEGRVIESNGEPAIELTFKDQTEKKIKETDEGHDRISSIELVLLDVSFFVESPQGWIDIFQDRVEEYGMKPKTHRTPIVLMSRDDRRIDLNQFKMTEAKDLLFKPLDRTYLKQKMLLSMQVKVDTRKSKDLDFIDHSEVIDMAKLGKAHEVSEYGLRIKNPRALGPGTYVRFYSTTLGGGLWGRCYESIETSSGDYDCAFAFFGATDNFLKMIRKTIKKEYAETNVS